MGVYKYLRTLWQKPTADSDKVWHERLVQWRKEPATVRVKKPTRLEAARAAGYKAKQGVLVVRQRLRRGGRMRPQIRKGRRSKAMRRKKIVSKSYQQIAEERVAKQYPNCEVLSSYYLTKDGIFYWYEIILVDTAHPAVKKDPQLKWITQKQHRGRAFRGLTTAGKRSRGMLTRKGKGAEKLRPSLRSNKRKSS